MSEFSQDGLRPGFLYSFAQYQQVMQLENCRDLNYRSQPQPLPENLVIRPLPGVDGGAIVELYQPAPANFSSDFSKVTLQVWQQTMMLYV